MEDAKLTVEMPPIEKQLVALNRLAEELEKETRNLFAKIAPVTRMEPREPEPSAPQPKLAGSELANRLENVAVTLNELLRDVRLVRARVEL